MDRAVGIPDVIEVCGRPESSSGYWGLLGLWRGGGSSLPYIRVTDGRHPPSNISYIILMC